LFISVWLLEIHTEGVDWVALTDLMLPHFFACPKTESKLLQGQAIALDVSSSALYPEEEECW
jgi:hypothetical protein